MEDKYPLVSIVFTSYNHKKFLTEALDSLVSQNYPNIELIIVDDNSTDGSQEILKTYQKFNNVIIKFNSVNSGSYVSASNYGASFAKGEFLIFAQCDDYSLSNQIQILSKILMENPEVGVVFSKSLLIDENSKVIGDDYHIREKKFKKSVEKNSLISGFQMRRFLSISCVIPNLSAALIRRELYINLGGITKDFLMAADWSFWLELTQLTNFYYIPSPLNNFRQHSNTIRSKTKIEKQLIEIFNVFIDHIKRYNLSRNEEKQFYIGFGNIWFTYFLEYPFLVLKCFPKLFYLTTKKIKLMFYFLFMGILNKINSIVFK